RRGRRDIGGGCGGCLGRDRRGGDVAGGERPAHARHGVAGQVLRPADRGGVGREFGQGRRGGEGDGPGRAVVAGGAGDVVERGVFEDERDRARLDGFAEYG